jgi:hypothetical protein
LFRDVNDIVKCKNISERAPALIGFVDDLKYKNNMQSVAGFMNLIHVVIENSPTKIWQMA